jgi:hypothetical protein
MSNSFHRITTDMNSNIYVLYSPQTKLDIARRHNNFNINVLIVLQQNEKNMARSTSKYACSSFKLVKENVTYIRNIMIL